MRFSEGPLLEVLLYGKSAELVFILSRETSKQLASVVVAGSDLVYGKHVLRAKKTLAV